MAVAIWRAHDHPYAVSATTLTAKLYPTTPSTQIEMVAIMMDLNWIADHAQEVEATMYSESLSTVTYVKERYFRPSLFNIKNALSDTYCRATQVLRITLIHVPSDSGIHQNEQADLFSTLSLREPSSGYNPTYPTSLQPIRIFPPSQYPRTHPSPSR